jgi:hypothetical protein
VHVDLPGVKEEDLIIDILADSLVIKAERRRVHSLDTDILHRSEKTYGKVQRTIPTPTDANFSTASAKFKDGGKVYLIYIYHHLKIFIILFFCSFGNQFPKKISSK